MTQLESARAGVITDEMRQVAKQEGLSPEIIREKLASGRVVILRNLNRHHGTPMALGAGLTTKVNANIGTSKDQMDMDAELEKLRVAIACGADTIMDLSTGGNIDHIRAAILKESPVPLGTVPLYQAVIDTFNRGQGIGQMEADELFATIEKQLSDGVDFITVHCGVTRESVCCLRREGRIMDIVSRGGAFTVEWMLYNKRENPLYEEFDRLVAVAKRYDAVLSLGDGLRPGCLADATDRGQVHELLLLGELTQRAWDAGVQVMIEGPGHVPLNQIESNVLLEKRLCHGAPFYVLGPLVTDIAPGYDHITAAIGGAIAARAGADFLCYVTPAEHLKLPSLEDVRAGVIATKIAGHAADIAKGIKGAWERDKQLSAYRKELNWEGMFALALDPEKARAYRASSQPTDAQVCTMCGEFCSVKHMSTAKDIDFW
jgi:phosphomethylpyrimidine synthase